MDISASTLVMGSISPRVSFDSGFSPLIDTYSRDDIAIADLNRALIPKQLASRRMTASVTSSSTTYATLAELTVPVNRLGALAFQFYLFYSTSQAAEGIGARLSFSGVATDVLIGRDGFSTPSVRLDFDSAASFGSAVPANGSGPGPLNIVPITLTGSCVVTTVGDLSVQIRAETGGAQNVTALASSWCGVWQP
jgi:hypothetical protein